MKIKEIKRALKNLPSAAAPFLSFTKEEVERVTTVFTDLKPQLNDFVYIGSDGEGNPICVHLNSREVYILDHEFDFFPGYMNRNIQDLERFIDIYKNYINHICENYGDDAFFEGHYPEIEIDNLEIKFSTIDPKAVREPAFWGSVLEVDKSMLTE